jgi:hypothetical protein
MGKYISQVPENVKEYVILSTSLFTCGMQLEIHTTNTKNPKPKDVLKL